MKPPVLFAVCVTALSMSACRQADGPVPSPDTNALAELVDVTRDLENVANNNPDGPEELAHDLRKYVSDQRPNAVPAVDELSRRTAQVLPKSKLSPQSAQQLAHNLWVTVSARELSERQVESLQNDVQSLLMSVGVAEPNAQQVAAQVGDVQRAVGDRARRWYELF
ncbi:MAG: hypothetical protein FJW14_10745 [Acidimicrobiia bacterium]|nr:hypothetical protein [Acidimicrobiia bacterium]